SGAVRAAGSAVRSSDSPRASAAAREDFFSTGLRSEAMRRDLPARTSSRALFILATNRSRMCKASEHFSRMTFRYASTGRRTVARHFVPKAYLIKKIVHFYLTNQELWRPIIRASMGTEKPKAD